MDSHKIVKFFHTLSIQIMQKDSYLLCVFLIFLKIIKTLFILHGHFKQGEKNKLNKQKNQWLFWWQGYKTFWCYYPHYL